MLLNHEQLTPCRTPMPWRPRWRRIANGRRSASRALSLLKWPEGGHLPVGAFDRDFSAPGRGRADARLPAGDSSPRYRRRRHAVAEECLAQLFVVAAMLAASVTCDRHERSRPRPGREALELPPAPSRAVSGRRHHGACAATTSPSPSAARSCSWKAGRRSSSSPAASARSRNTCGRCPKRISSRRSRSGRVCRARRS